MSGHPAEDRVAAPFSATLALVAAAVAGGLLGAAAGVPGETALAVFAGVWLGQSIAALDGDGNDRIAAGSVGTALASTVAAGVLVWLVTVRSLAQLALVALVLVAVAAVSTDRSVGLTTAAGEATQSAVFRSVVPLTVGTLLAVLVHGDAFALVATVAVSGVAATVGSVAAYDALVLLELQVVATVFLFNAATSVIDERLPARQRESIPILRDVTLDLGDAELDLDRVPNAVWGLLVLQVLLVPFPGPDAAVAWALGLLSYLGLAVSVLLTYGVVHAVLLVPGVLCLTVLAGEALRSLVVVWAGTKPPLAAAKAAGGAVVAVAVPLLTAVPPVGNGIAAAVPANTTLGAAIGAFGVGATLLGAVGVALVAFQLAVAGALGLAAFNLYAADRLGFSLGATALFLAALVAAAADALAPVVFLGVAAALAVWDLGATSVDLGTQLGREAETRRGEVVHAAGTAIVGAVGVVVATVAVYLVLPFATALAPWQAILALACTVLAVLAATVATARGVGE